VARWRDSHDARAQQMRALRQKMADATTYKDWRDHARQLDRLDSNRLGGRCSVEESKLYDQKLLRRKLAHLRHVREVGNIREMMFNLRSDLFRNIANIAKRWGGCCVLGGDACVWGGEAGGVDTGTAGEGGCGGAAARG
jgi:hypothetical protein